MDFSILIIMKYSAHKDNPLEDFFLLIFNILNYLITKETKSSVVYN